MNTETTIPSRKRPSLTKIILGGATLLMAAGLTFTAIETGRQMQTLSSVCSDSHLMIMVDSAHDVSLRLNSLAAGENENLRHELSLQLAADLDLIARLDNDCTPQFRSFTRDLCMKMIQDQDLHPERHLTADPASRAMEIKVWSDLRETYSNAFLNARIEARTNRALTFNG